MDNLIDFKKIYYKDIKVSIIWLLFITFIILLIVFLFSNKYYIKYYKTNGIVVDNNVLSITVNKDDIKVLQTNKILIINNKKFAYKIKKIQNPYTYSDNLYTDVLIEINLDKYNTKNNYFEIKIPYEKKTILKYTDVCPWCQVWVFSFSVSQEEKYTERKRAEKRLKSGTWYDIMVIVHNFVRFYTK